MYISYIHGSTRRVGKRLGKRRSTLDDVDWVHVCLDQSLCQCNQGQSLCHQLLNMHPPSSSASVLSGPLSNFYSYSLNFGCIRAEGHSPLSKKRGKNDVERQGADLRASVEGALLRERVEDVP